MSEPTLLLLRIGFLLLLWFFIFAILYALRSDLFGGPVRRIKNDGMQATAATPPTPHPTPAVTPSGGALPSALGDGLLPADAPHRDQGAPRQLVITTGVATGTTIPLDENYVTIGRSSDSTLVIVDEYTSTHHARLSLNENQWILTDLDSTNGTRLDGERVSEPLTVPPYTPITIGTTTFELRP